MERCRFIDPKGFCTWNEQVKQPVNEILENLRSQFRAGGDVGNMISTISQESEKIPSKATYDSQKAYMDQATTCTISSEPQKQIECNRYWPASDITPVQIIILEPGLRPTVMKKLQKPNSDL